ncbi:MAG: DUF2807 domain-containing protein [Pyrinomonadaceae bacterium]|nr:DUF2807 domain-containing protein [Pyrinomonadaceae bacterium]
MKNLSLCFVTILSLILLNACDTGSLNQTAGSGNLKSESRNVPSFETIEAGGAIELEIVANEADQSVKVEIDDNLLQFVKTEVISKTLRIERTSNFKTSNPVRVKITMPKLINLTLSGASSAKISNLFGDKINFDISGASKTSVDGTTKTLTAKVSGASELQAEDLKCEDVAVDASGASKASVFAANSLGAKLSGASSMIYGGNPKTINKNVADASSLTSK